MAAGLTAGCARRLFVLRCGGERTMWGLFDPWDPDCARVVEIPYYCYAVDHPEKMRQRRLPAYLWNPDAVIGSWEVIERRRDAAGATLLFSHYPAPDQLVLAPEVWRPIG